MLEKYPSSKDLTIRLNCNSHDRSRIVIVGLQLLVRKSPVERSIGVQPTQASGTDGRGKITSYNYLPIGLHRLREDLSTIRRRIIVLSFWTIAGE
jgi:hypothetical protein